MPSCEGLRRSKVRMLCVYKVQYLRALGYRLVNIVLGAPNRVVLEILVFQVHQETRRGTGPVSRPDQVLAVLSHCGTV